MFNKTILVNFVLIFIILYLANQISDNKLLDSFKNIFYFYKKEEEKKVIKIEDKTNNINSFLNSLVNKNSLEYLNTSNFDKPFKVSQVDYNTIKTFLENKFQLKKHMVKNINLEENLIFYKNKGGFEIKPMQIVGEYYNNKEFLGNLKLQIEISFRIDNSASIFIGPTKFNKKSGSFIIHRIFMISLDKNIIEKKNTKKKIVQELDIIKLSEDESTELKFEINDIQENNEKIDSEFNSINSLIPDKILLSSEELSSFAQI